LLTEKIKKFAKETGFDLVGISKAELPGLHADSVERWIEKGFAGSMDYMVRDGKRRAYPKEVLPGAESVISLVINYFHPEDPKPSVSAGKVAKYAYGTDYHKIIEKKLKLLTQLIREAGGPGTQVKGYVDTGPILEKAFAKESGLGFFGKNTNIITKEFGSFVFLASLITNLELVYDTPHEGGCGSCRICIDACPTGALLGNYELDARRCIAYVTIEAKEEPFQEIKKGIGEWLFGCDICQDVCPYNRKAKTTHHTELYPGKKAGTWVELDRLKEFKDEEEFKLAYQGSPLRRPKLKGLLRNAAMVEYNLQS